MKKRILQQVSLALSALLLLSCLVGLSPYAFAKDQTVTPTLQSLATVTPQSGSAKKIQVGNLIFSDRTTHRFAASTPDWLVGQPYLMDSLENGSTVTVTGGGRLYVITPVDGTVNSQVQALERQGYRILTTLDAHVLSTTVNEALVLLYKDVSAGETVSFTKWAILLAKLDPLYASPEDLALTPPSVLQRPTAEEYQDGNRNWQGMPGLARDEKNGRLWATWYSGGDGEGSDNWAVLYTSADNGKTWTGPITVVDHTHPVRIYDPNLWIDPNGRMWMIWAQSYTYFDGRCGTWMMYTDNPESETPTWSTPVRVANGIAINDPVVLSNGNWLLPAAIWKKDTVVEGLEREVNSNVYISRDEGLTWSYLGSVPAYEGERDCDENMIVEQTDGSLRMLIRTKTGIEESYSYDGGATWSSAKDAHLTRVVSKFQITRLQSGNLLLLYNSPPDGSATRSHLTAALSTDDGKTWQYKLLLDERYRASYPDVQQAPDGSIYIIYDCLRTKHGNLLLSVITEQDIMAGRPVSEGSFLARLVNDNTASASPPLVDTEENTTDAEGSTSPDITESQAPNTNASTEETTNGTSVENDTFSEPPTAPSKPSQPPVDPLPWILCGIIAVTAAITGVLLSFKKTGKG